MELIALHEYPLYIPVLARWFHNQWGYLHPSRTRTDIEQQLTEQPGANNLPFTYILDADGYPIGTASLVSQDMPGLAKVVNKSPWLASVYVDKPYRQQGFGAKLVNAIEQKAQASGFDTIYLFTPDQERWYTKLGWQMEETTNYNGSEVTIMKKLIL